MLLSNVNIIGKEGPHYIRVEDEIIQTISNIETNHEIFPGEIRIDFENVIAFPGLINSHDHLDFNLFAKTGNRIYNNYTEWGEDIHSQNRDAINAVLKIPEHVRIQSGVYKNLLNGFTTVVNHGKKININSNLINVIQDIHNLHSVQFQKYWRWKLNRPFRNDKPFVIHIGEGTDELSHQEINSLIRWNLFKRKIIGVHGVAMDMKQAKYFEALVWCPDSNYFLFERTAAVDKLKTKTSILFGTDSTLTSDWNMWNQIRLARNTQMVSDEELFEMLTVKPSAVWDLKGTGRIEKDYKADIVIAKKNNNDVNLEAFFSLNPADILLVILNGEIKLIDKTLISSSANKDINTDNFSELFIGDSSKYVEGSIEELKTYAPYNRDVHTI